MGSTRLRHLGRARLALLLFVLAACDDDASAGALGAPCADGCAEGLACVLDERFVGGYCSAVCDDAACPGDGLCERARTPALCLAPCAADDDCRDGYQCWRGACQPRCAGDADCLGGACVAGSCDGPACVLDEDCGGAARCVANACVPDLDGGAMLATGAPCARDHDCASGTCLPEALGGRCAGDCSDPDDCFGFEIDMGCSAVPDDGGGVRTLCTPLVPGGGATARACEADDDCAARTCQEGQCTEACDGDDDCLAGQVCAELARAGGTYRGCGYPARAGAVAIEEVEMEVELAAGRVSPLDLLVPPDTVSVTLSAHRVSGDPLPVSFSAVIDPADATIFDVGEISALRDTPLRWLPFDPAEVATMLVSNSTADRLPMRGGRYVWAAGTVPRTDGDAGSARVALRALIKRAEGGAVASGALDLDITLVGVGLSAASAPGDTRLQGALTRLGAILGAAGVTLGDVRYHDASAADASAYGVLESTEGEDSELAALFRTSAGRSGRRLNIYLVRSIEGGEGFASLGVAGGIPGPVDIHGTRQSGVVAAFDEAVVGSGATGSAVIGHILAHEIGHYLGLYHSTERLRPCGPGEDPFEYECAPFAGGDVLADTAHGDDANLMYWSLVGAGTNTGLSAGQGLVLRASALVRP